MYDQIVLDSWTLYEIRRLFRQESMTVEELSDMFGIPESRVSKILRGEE